MVQPIRGRYFMVMNLYGSQRGREIKRTAGLRMVSYSISLGPQMQFICGNYGKSG